jgi:hypothetical protein
MMLYVKQLEGRSAATGIYAGMVNATGRTFACESNSYVTDAVSQREAK